MLRVRIGGAKNWGMPRPRPLKIVTSDPMETRRYNTSVTDANLVVPGQAFYGDPLEKFDPLRPTF